ncbi:MULTISPECIES: AAA family ATPase [Streptomyces]|uniref:AAA family ATPase n=1 Tax=Streptomyces TaxID=1883 RepID=UPI00324F2CF1
MTERAFHGPDPRDGRVYVMPAGLALAVRVALATDRPLLLSGEPGSGKSSLAPFYAREQGLRYYEHVVTSRTRATDLLWTFDSVRRLADAQARRVRLNDAHYVRPGVLWRSLAPDSARRRGVPTRPPEGQNPQGAGGAVVLIDEIDKADPDVPNSLLVPLGSQEFTVAETDTTISREPGVDRHLIVITTNGERELPQAFLRRCVMFRLPEPEAESLVRIAELHLEYEGVDLDAPTRELVRMLAAELVQARRDQDARRGRFPSTAEYLDAVRACRELGIRPGDEDWDLVRGLTMAKPSQRER